MGWIGSREFKIYLVVVGAVAFLALSVTIGVMLPGYIRYTKTQKDQTTVESHSSVDIAEFIIPESYKKAWDYSVIPFREDRDHWTEEDISEFWQDPKGPILEYLEKENENLINEMFKDIP